MSTLTDAELIQLGRQVSEYVQVRAAEAALLVEYRAWRKRSGLTPGPAAKRRFARCAAIAGAAGRYLADPTGGRP